MYICYKKIYNEIHLFICFPDQSKIPPYNEYRSEQRAPPPKKPDPQSIEDEKSGDVIVTINLDSEKRMMETGGENEKIKLHQYYDVNNLNTYLSKYLGEGYRMDDTYYPEKRRRSGREDSRFEDEDTRHIRQDMFFYDSGRTINTSRGNIIGSLYLKLE